MEHFPQVPGSIRLDSDALGRMHTQPSQKASDRQRQQAISQGLSSTAISRGLIEAIDTSIASPVSNGVFHGDQPWPH